MDLFSKSPVKPRREEAIPGRSQKMKVSESHFVNGRRIVPPFPDIPDIALFGMGCFWGAERCFWENEDIYSTMVGYAGGFTANPTYEEICTGMTGHNEVVRILFDGSLVSYEKLLKRFWESHDPTQGMQQGNDRGTQYRSGIYTYNAEQNVLARSSLTVYEKSLTTSGFPPITTEIVEAPEFYYAEDYHQQYLAKNPAGYCGLGGTGIECQANN